MDIYGLIPTGFEGLIANTGKLYRFANATIAADSPDEARRLAMNHDTYGLDWGDPKKFLCLPVRVYGPSLQYGHVGYQIASIVATAH